MDNERLTDGPFQVPSPGEVPPAENRQAEKDMVSESEGWTRQAQVLSKSPSCHTDLLFWVELL